MPKIVMVKVKKKMCSWAKGYELESNQPYA